MCLVCSEDFPKEKDGRIHYLDTPKALSDYENIFANNRFDSVIYFSEFLTPDRMPFHEVENLSALLASAASHNGRTSRFIYVIPSIRLQETEGENFASLCLSASLSLIARYQKETAGKTSFAIIRTPYITGSLSNGDFLKRTFQAAAEKHELYLPWPLNAQLPLLYEGDLAAFFRSFLELWDGSSTDFRLNPLFAEGKKNDVAAFVSELQKETGCKVKTGPETDGEPLVFAEPEDNPAMQQYSWSAETDLTRKIHALHTQYEKRYGEKQKRFLSILHIPRGLITALELLVGAVLTQYLIHISGSSAQFRMIDYRLLYVVIMATIYGSRVGFFAALIMSGSLIYAYQLNGISGTMLLYDAGNWIPFILLFGVAAVCGYTRQSMRDRISILEKDKEDLSRENAALNGLYNDASRTRDIYRQDLMMSQNSFGEIFEVVQKLNYLHPDAIYRNAVPIFEEILDTDSVAIYDISDKNAVFARLEVCSSGKKDFYHRSIRLSDYPEISEEFQKGGLWINKQAKPHLPSYIAGVTDEDGHLAIAVFIDDIPFARMTGYYANIVRVLVGIMQSFLLRAFHYTRQQKQRYYYPDTILMHESYFAGRFRQMQEMAKSGITSWRLLQIDGEGKDVKAWDSRLAGRVKTTDDACYGDDGNVYLLLNQVDEKTEDIVLHRYQGYGFSCRFVSSLPSEGKEQDA